MKHASKTNWKQVDAIKDEDIDYTDSPEVTEEMFNMMKFREPIKKGIYIKLDTDIIDFFKKNSKKYQTRINEVLKAYKNALEKKPTAHSKLAH